MLHAYPQQSAVGFQSQPGSLEGALRHLSPVWEVPEGFWPGFAPMQELSSSKIQGFMVEASIYGIRGPCPLTLFWDIWSSRSAPHMLQQVFSQVVQSEGRV